MGKLVSALQTGITVSSANKITGTLKYVTGYTQFSETASEQSGNYLALKFSGNWDSATLAYNGNTIALDSDKNAVIRVADKTKALTLTATRQGNTETVSYDLTGLTLEASA